MNSKEIIYLAHEYSYIKKKEALKILNIAKYGRLTCEICKKHMARSSIDHVVPKSKNGSSELRNLRLAHSNCNSIRGDKFTIMDLIHLLF